MNVCGLQLTGKNWYLVFGFALAALSACTGVLNGQGVIDSQVDADQALQVPAFEVANSTYAFPVIPVEGSCTEPLEGSQLEVTGDITQKMQTTPCKSSRFSTTVELAGGNGEKVVIVTGYLPSGRAINRIYKVKKDLPVLALTKPSFDTVLGAAKFPLLAFEGTCSLEARKVNINFVGDVWIYDPEIDDYALVTNPAVGSFDCLSAKWSGQHDWNDFYPNSSSDNFAYSVAEAKSDGTVIDSLTATFTRDLSAPSPVALKLGFGVDTVNSPTVRVDHVVSGEPAEMYVTDTAGCNAGGAWEAYQAVQTKTFAFTNGTQQIFAKYRDIAGNESSCVASPVVKLDQTGDMALSAQYPGFSKWNSYVINSGSTWLTANGQECTGSVYQANGCIHTGDLKKIVLYDKTSCSGISADDNLGAFNWYCDDNLGAGPVVISSLGFKAGKGLFTLVDFTVPEWRDMRLSVHIGASSRQTVLKKWWSNPVIALPDNSTTSATTLSGADTLYTVNASQLTLGYGIGADGISIVVKPGSKLTAVAGAANLMSLNGRRRFYVEGAFDAAKFSGDVLSAMNCHLIQARNFAFTNAANNSVTFNGTTGGVFRDGTFANAGYGGQFMQNSSGQFFRTFVLKVDKLSGGSRIFRAATFFRTCSSLTMPAA